tara:strand:- start:35220 stop:36476 length:1257 start_codon:yes stop_codon:yes gene_type:complete
MDSLGTECVLSIKANPKIPQFRVRASDPISINSDARTISYLVSDETPDRMGDIIRVKGWDLANYKRNPVILWAHDGQTRPPIGKAKNVRRRYGPARLTAEVEFAPPEAHEFADTIYRLASRGFVRATSVGFLPVETEDIDEKKRDALGIGPYGQVFSASELMEISVVAVPANPSALQDGVKALTSEGAFDLGKEAQFFEAFPPTEEIALARVRAKCRSLVDFGYSAAQHLSDSIAEPAKAYNAGDPVELAMPEALVKEGPDSELGDSLGGQRKSPACREDDETTEECVTRKVPELIDEGMDDDQAVAAAHSMCETACADEYKSDLRLVEAVASLIEQQAEQTRATRQLVDSLTDLTKTLHGESRGGTQGGSEHEPDAGVPDADEITQEKVDQAVNGAVRGFAERVRRDLLNSNPNGTN